MRGWPFTKYLVSFSLVIGIYLPAFTLVNDSKANALSGSDWQVGRIMDEAVFFNPSTMNPGDIQSFLNAKVPVCDTDGSQIYSGSTTRAQYGSSRGYPPPYTCLKDYSQSIPAKSPDSYCGGSVTAGTKTAAQIIYEVGHACGVNPKVLIVLLQKEQSLVTDDWPWSIQYRSAAGYGCPDTAPCDSEYYGFFNQVYNAARQFQRYAKQPSSFNFGGGRTSYLQYNPNAGCGGTNVYMQNQATAGLYNYTPYQPNQAALNNLYGSGDSCSAYGNRNFWRMYIDWFGSPHSNDPWGWMYEGHEGFADAARTQPFTSTATAAPSGKIYIRLKARNMGNQVWDKSFLRLGTSRTNDRTSQFVDASWINSVRPAELVENTIVPGQIGTFEFTLQTPSTLGTYNEYFNVVAEGRSWLNDPGLFFTINVNNATGPTNSTNTALNSGVSLNVGEYLLSPDAHSTLVLQRDGNLVLSSNFKPLWYTGPVAGAHHLTMQGDGNLVLYNQSNVPLWSSQTQGNTGARLVLQSDGNMVIYSSSNSALWATYTLHIPNHLAYVNTRLPTGLLYPGQSIDTPDRRFRLTLQGDGNLVLYSPNRATWATGTDGRSVSFLAMQGDGNLVLYDQGMRPIWNSGTAGLGDLHLSIQQDGNLVLYNRFGKPYWHTATHGVE